MNPQPNAFNLYLSHILTPIAEDKLSSATNVYVVSSLLNRCGIFHQCRVGHIHDKRNNIFIDNYCWIELGKGWIVDLSCPYEPTEDDPFPKRVFHLAELKDFEYVGTAFETPNLTDEELDDFIGDLYLPTLKMLRQSWADLGIPHKNLCKARGRVFITA